MMLAIDEFVKYVTYMVDVIKLHQITDANPRKTAMKSTFQKELD
jgi:hypothetical protein